eukprot:TRINITY_DN4878_c0_g1_i1.p1 TRINITY_DN4878_c0_g1~~TRINITY_DN4878_c0_g1_i1.p1  ORF type:complete len:2162 (+),score=668.51 TRINITY_DN4878_c0_g1_i1:53-6538(+)
MSADSEVTRWRAYDYKANSNLVLQSTTPRSKVSSEPTGEPESLKDKRMYTFGDRAVTSKAPIDEHLKKTQKKRAAPFDANESSRPSKKVRTTVLDNDELEGIKYQPKTKETRQAYDNLLNFVRQKLGDQQRNVIMSASDEILAIIKDEEIKPKDKQQMLEELLPGLNQDGYTSLHKICQEITDYAEEGVASGVAGDDEGISVMVFGDEEEKEEEQFEIPEEEDDDMNVGEETELMETVRAKGEEEEEDALDLDPNTIDAYWLQREISKYYEDAVQSQKLADEALEILQSRSRLGDLENDLVELFGLVHFDIVKKLVRNRLKVVYCTKLAKASAEEKQSIENEMSKIPEAAALLNVLKGKAASEGATLGGRMRKEARDLSKLDSRRERQERESNRDDSEMISEPDLSYSGPTSAIPISEYIDLENLSFQQGSHLMSNKNCKLPQGTFQKPKKGYEEVYVPALKSPAFKEDEKIITINEMPSWTHPAFKGIRELNRIQSAVCKSFFESSENLLLCAPTGAGKTNCAMLAMLHEIGLHLDHKSCQLLDNNFKIIYVAPMKSLVQEMVFNFSKRLSPYGIKVNELTGDASLSKQQIEETHVIVTTPEKWDIITRKSGDRTYTELVRLIIIDEVHLLHDERGPVLEALVSRTIRQIESSQEMVRIIGLSATLPNYQEVAMFLRVKQENLFCFPNAYRPIPLEQTFVGISVKKPYKRFVLMNQICYEKVMEQAGTNQILVFVHSRKETYQTAKEIRDRAISDDVIGKFLEDAGSREILLQEAEEVKSAELKELLPYGFAIHHAGLSREDRTLVEDLFTDKHIQVLVSTATLAWGVNLPAHTVIIKGTKIYNPEKGDWVELSPLDVMQMLGRAGRPQFDTKGEGVLITGRQELQFYLSLLNEQLPIESQFIGKLADNLNAEIVLGTVQNVKEAVNWLGYTYLYIRMLRSPELYGVSQAERETDKVLEKRRRDLIHSAATILMKNNLIKYDRKSGNFQSTDLGRIASHYYITHQSMNTYNEHLKITSSDIEILRVFSLSGEFKHIAVRPDERTELKKLVERVPIPIKESIEEPSAKINALLQSYISRLSLEGFSLATDMVYVRQSAGRIFRALFEIALKRGWASVAEKCLRMCLMVEKRTWGTASPLRQFKALPEEIVQKLEKKDLTIERLYDLDSHEIGEGIEYGSLGKTVYNLVHRFPRLDLSATVQPVTRSLLRVELTITPDFTFVDKHHGKSVSFWILVEDVDGDHILHSEMFILKEKYSSQEHYLTFTVPLFEPMPPQYFIKVIADRWLGSESVLPISFRSLILPEKYPPNTELLDLQPLPVAALKNSSFESLYRSIKNGLFNAIQTQVFNTLYNTDQNSVVCAPTGSGKTICAEFAMLREFSKETPGIVVYIAPMESIAQERYRDWSKKFAGLDKQVNKLTGEWNVDQKLIGKADIVITTADIWDGISRNWRKRKIIQAVKLYIVDEIHLIGSDNGPTLEIVVSRIRYISQQLKQLQKETNTNNIRIVALSTSLANAKDIGEWVGATPHSLFNFHPNVRPVPLEIHLQGFDNPHFKARILSMNKPLLYAVSHYSEEKPVVIFVPSRKIARSLAKDLITHTTADANPKRYLHCTDADMKPWMEHISSKALQESLQLGVGFFHEGLTTKEQDVVSELFKSGATQVVIATHSMCWKLHTQASLVIIMGTQYYEGKEHRYVDYSITDILQMIGRAGRVGYDSSAKCVIFSDSRKKEFYKKFIYEPLPIESHLDHYLHDHLNSEIVTKTIENKQDAVDYLTWTFYYRRLTQNPNYYNMQGVSHRHLSDHLSELIENTIKDLVNSHCIRVVDDMDLEALNLAMISSYYNVKYTTVELYNFSLTEKTKMKGIIEILTNASEFEQLHIRYREDRLLEKLAANLPSKITKPDFTSTSTKVNILLQSHFSRRILPPDLAVDQSTVVASIPRLIQAMVDVTSSNEFLSPALHAMELAQMVVQAMWDNESNLKQLPHFTQELLDKIASEAPEIESIGDLLGMDDDKREDLLQMTKSQLADVAQAANRYPDIELKHELQTDSEVKAGETVKISVQLERDFEEGEKLGPVYAPFFPGEKSEGWWLLVGDKTTNKLLLVKKVVVDKPHLDISLEFEAPETPGNHDCMLYFICDSYLGVDQEYEIPLKVLAKEDTMDTS